MKKQYTLEVISIDDDITVKTTNNGFNAIELVGLLRWKLDDVVDQMKGIIDPSKITRIVKE